MTSNLDEVPSPMQADSCSVWSFCAGEIRTLEQLVDREEMQIGLSRLRQVKKGCWAAEPASEELLRR